MDIVTYMLIGLIGFAVILLLSKPLGRVLKLLAQGVVGVAGIFMLNAVLAPWSVYVGVNLITFAYVGILGLPGLVSLYLIKFIL